MGPAINLSGTGSAGWIVCVLIAGASVTSRRLPCTQQPWGTPADCSVDSASDVFVPVRTSVEEATPYWRKLQDDPHNANDPGLSSALDSNTAGNNITPPAPPGEPAPGSRRELHGGSSTQPPMAAVASPTAAVAPGPSPPPGPPSPKPVPSQTHSACGRGCAGAITAVVLLVIGGGLIAWAAIKKLRPGFSLQHPSSWRSCWEGEGFDDGGPALEALYEGQKVFYHMPGQENGLGRLQGCMHGDEFYTIVKHGGQHCVRVIKPHVAPYYEQGTPLIYNAAPGGRQSVCTVIETNTSHWPPSYLLRERTSGKEINTFARNLRLLQASKPLDDMSGSGQLGHQPGTYRAG